jgi:phosphomannomutase
MQPTCHPFKAYDIRGRDDQVTTDFARSVATAFAQLTDAATILVARDMRPTSPTLAAAFIDGATRAGADVIDLGLASTDTAYFASGQLALPAAVITASHNPADDNGIKLVRAGASPVARDTGLEDLHHFVHTGRLPHHYTRSGASRTGTVTAVDMRPAYTTHLRGLVDPTFLRPLTVVIDAGNGMAGHVLPALLKDLPLTVAEPLRQRAAHLRRDTAR